MLECGTRVKVLGGKYEGSTLSIIGVWEVGKKAKVSYTLYDKDTNIFIIDAKEEDIEPIQDDTGGLEI